MKGASMKQITFADRILKGQAERDNRIEHLALCALYTERIDEYQD
jgi:hypothetical protein